MITRTSIVGLLNIGRAAICGTADWSSRPVLTRGNNISEITEETQDSREITISQT